MPLGDVDETDGEAEMTWLPQSTGGWLVCMCIAYALGYWMGVYREAKKARVAVEIMSRTVEEMRTAAAARVAMAESSRTRGAGDDGR